VAAISSAGMAVGSQGSGRGGRLLERGDELGRLRAALGAVRGGAGGLVLIGGPAGIGKSVLLDAVAADAGGLLVLRASGAMLERDFPFGVAIQLLERTLAGADPQSRGGLLEGPAALAAELFDPAEAAVDDGPADWVDPEPGLRHGLYWLIANLTERRPVLAVVDDGQWADVQSWRWLAYLARRVHELALLLCVAVRTGESGSVGEGIDALTMVADDVLMPAPLTLDAATKLAGTVLQSGGGEELAAICHKASRGNPLYLTELLRSIAAGELSLDDLRSERASAPATVRAMVLTRLGGMSDAARALARALAVLGDGAELRHARALAGLGREQAVGATGVLAAAELVAGERTLSFKHPVIRAAVYESIAAPERARYHGRAGRLLAREHAAAESIAAHLLVSAPDEDPHVVERLLAAGRRALERGAPSAAVSYLARALEEPPPAGRLPVVLVALADAEAREHHSSAIAHYRRALELIEEPGEQARLWMRIARTLVQLGQLEEAQAIYLRLAAESGDVDCELALEAEACALLTSVLQQAGGRKAPAPTRTLAAPAAGRTPGERAVLAHLAYQAAMQIRPAMEVRALAERALASGRLLEQDTADAPWFFLTVNALCFADALVLADEQLAAGIADCVRRGSLLGYPVASAFRARVACRRGRITEALASANDALGVEEVGSSELWKPVAVAFLADAQLERGELEQAARLIEVASVEHRLGESVTWNLVLDSRGRLRLAQDRYEEALADFLACGELQEEWGGANPALIPWRSSAAIAAAHTGDHQLAHRLLKVETQRARRFGASRPIGIALHAAGLTAALAGRHDQAVTRLSAAVDVLEGTEARLEHTRALVDLGAAVRRAGQPASARTPLRAGLDLAVRCGANALATRARDELRASGARPRRDHNTGADALTPSELRISQLAIDGLTNRQIATRLFLTTKTIEMHLAHTYRKLNISSRRELSTAIHPPL
jgi:DNA-binding CsgD family transcriptional regulator